MTQGLMSPPSSSCSHTHSQLHSVHTFPCSLPFRSTVCNQIRAQTSFTSQEVKLTQSLPRGEMAQQGVELDRETFSCSICLDLLKDPVALHCGHSYCINCIQSFWDVEDEKRIYSCPQCRQSFTPRPVLMENIMLADLVEKLKKTGLQDAPADHCYAGAEDVEEHKGHDTVSAAAERTERQRELEGRRPNIQQRIQDTEKDVKLLQQEVEAISRSADKAVEHSEKITELKRKDAELKKLSHTEDHSQFLHNYPSLSALSEATHSSSINIRPRRYFEDVTAAVSGVRDKLQDALRDTQTNVSLTGTEVDVLRPQPEPKTRAEFLRYSRHITLDPNTAFTWLLLSEGKRKAKLMTKQQSYPHHPDRFTIWSQVLSRESLTGRCYWEVERRGTVYVAVAYKNISRAGWDDECHFGHNEKSWMLTCDKNSYNFYHNTVQTRVSGPRSSRVGVYLDHSAGILSFYSVSKTMTLLHRVQTTFTQPLYAGLYFHDEGDTAELC